MLKTIAAPLAGAFFMLAWAMAPAHAQSGVPTAVAVCGSGVNGIQTGHGSTLTVDLNGTLCTNASGGGGSAATIADCADVAEGCTSDPAWISGSGTVIALLKALVAQPASSAITNWAGGVLGAMANYGTSPGAVLVPGVNAFMTGAANFAASAAAIPASLAAIGVSDGSTSCSGGPCLIAPKALATGVAGTASADFVSTLGGAGAYPVPVGGASTAVLGSYCVASASGTIGAGLSSASPVYSFRYGGANLAVVRNVWITAQDITTGFTAGNATFNLFAARSFSASDTGGTAATLTGNNGKLRTSFATTAVSNIQIANTGTMSAGTRTLDAQPLATLVQALPTTIGYQIFGPYQSFFQQPNVGAQPLQLAQNEGFVVQATVPATGTWVETITTCWDEMAAF